MPRAFCPVRRVSVITRKTGFASDISKWPRFDSMGPANMRVARFAVYAGTVIAFCLSVCSAVASEAAMAGSDALLYRELAVPRRFLANYGETIFGGDVRIGDLTGNGRCDFLVYRCNHGAPKGAHRGGMKPCFLGAFDIDGRELWSQGEGGGQPSRPMSVAVHDFDGDGAAEVLCFWHKPTADARMPIGSSTCPPTFPKSHRA